MHFQKLICSIRGNETLGDLLGKKGFALEIKYRFYDFASLKKKNKLGPQSVLPSCLFLS